MTEKMNARIGILPLLQAEHDRKYAMSTVHPLFYSQSSALLCTALQHCHAMLAHCIFTDSYPVTSLVHAVVYGYDLMSSREGRKKTVTFLPPSRKALRALITSSYSNAKRNK